MGQDPVRNEDFQVIMTMNVNGPGTSRMRKLALKTAINHHFPSIVLLQEFRWTQLHWFYNDVPIIHQTYALQNNHHQAAPRILVDTFNFHLRVEQNDEERLCLRIQERQGVDDIVFISWHGRHRGLNLHQKIEDFTNLIQFATQAINTYQLPVLIGGDFNLEINNVRTLVHDPFILYDYGGSARRLRRGRITVIDYFIATRNLHLFDMKPINPRGLHIIAELANDQLDRYQHVQERMSPFDHDPIIAKLEDNLPLEIFHRGNVHSEDMCIKCEFRHFLSLLTNLSDDEIAEAQNNNQQF